MSLDPKEWYPHAHDDYVIDYIISTVSRDLDCCASRQAQSLLFREHSRAGYYIERPAPFLPNTFYSFGWLRGS